MERLCEESEDAELERWALASSFAVRVIATVCADELTVKLKPVMSGVRALPP
jgi:hypothetical protein